MKDETKANDVDSQTIARPVHHRCSAALLLLAVVFVIAGCKREDHRAIWNVQLVRPDGTVQKTFKVKSLYSPKANPLWGGQSELYLTDNSGNHKSTDLYAPVGWMWESNLSR